MRITASVATVADTIDLNCPMYAAKQNTHVHICTHIIFIMYTHVCLKELTVYIFYTCITQYYRTAYLGMTRVVSGQFPCIENIQHGATAKLDCEEPKEHHSSTKEELGYTLIPTMHTMST